MKYSLGISNFLEEISSLSHSIVFLYFLALITEEGFLSSPCYSLELCIGTQSQPSDLPPHITICLWTVYASQVSRVAQMVKNRPLTGFNPVGRSPGEGNGYPLQYSCLENSLDRGTWLATVHGVTKSPTTQ